MLELPIFARAFLHSFVCTFVCMLTTPLTAAGPGQRGKHTRGFMASFSGGRPFEGPSDLCSGLLPPQALQKLAGQYLKRDWPNIKVDERADYRYCVFYPLASGYRPASPEFPPSPNDLFSCNPGTSTQCGRPTWRAQCR